MEGERVSGLRLHLALQNSSSRAFVNAWCGQHRTATGTVEGEGMRSPACRAQVNHTGKGNTVAGNGYRRRTLTTIEAPEEPLTVSPEKEYRPTWMPSEM